MLKTGLIGLGRMGRYHLNVMQELPGVELAGICDVNPDAVTEISGKFGVKGYTDYREMLPNVDAVTIAAPTRFHYDIAKDCIEAGKHILVEKPITTDFDQAKDLFARAEKAGVVLNIGHVERFNGAVQELKKIVHKPNLVESRRVGPFDPRVAGDSVVLDLMIHDIDIILNVVNRKVVKVQAMGSPVYSQRPDFATVNLMFDNQAVANIFVSRVTQKKDRTMSISQDEAFIQLDYTSQDINIYRKGASQHIFGQKELTYKNEYVLERLFVYKDNPLKQEIKHFLECIDGGACRMVSVEHELSSLRVALAIDEILGTDGMDTMEFAD